MKPNEQQLEVMDLVTNIIYSACTTEQVKEVQRIIEACAGDKLVVSGMKSFEMAVKKEVICPHAYNGFIAGVVLMAKQGESKQVEELFKMYMGGH